jgi:hypothetical protein
LTEGLVLDGKRCTGVRYSVAAEVREARAVARSWSAPARSTSDLYKFGDMLARRKSGAQQASFKKRTQRSV